LHLCFAGLGGSEEKMKWYFASNSKSTGYETLIKAAVASALKNTTLEPHFIYDGESDALTHWLEENGVKIIYHRSNLYDSLKNFYDEAALNIASGAFLRCDIPMIEKEDEIVLYTDCDVIFLKDVNSQNAPTPKYFACSSQFNKKDFVDFNTGVMFMNVKKLAQSYDEFVDFIGQNLSKLYVFDQSAYQLFYSGKNEPLDIKFNHKPYWGADNNAVILHYHGPKPVNFMTEDSIKTLNPIYYNIYKKNPAAYEYYLNLIRAYNPQINYDLSAFELLKKGVYPLVKTHSRPFSIRLKTFLRKKFEKIKGIFKKLSGK